METTTTQTINKRQAIIWSMRILLSILFLLSAVAKLWPTPYFAVTTFEYKQLLPMGFGETTAMYFSRILIGCEFALGFLLLQPHFFKRLVLPVSFLMLLVFCIHLTYTIFSTGNSGSCGCFGDLLPMTPLEAIIKNVIAMVLMGFVYKMMEEDKTKSNFPILLSVTFASVLGIFMLAPMKASSQENKEGTQQKVVVVPDEDPAQTPGTNGTASTGNSGNENQNGKAADGKTTDEKGKTEEKKKDDAPVAKKSGYASIFPDVDSDKKLLCFFAPGCEHCQQAAKEITEMKKTVPGFPDVRIVFMNEEAERIPEFFEFAGAKYTYTVMDIGKFWQTIGNRDTPGVFYIWNGNVVKVYDGIDANAFKAKELKAMVQKLWSEVK